MQRLKQVDSISLVQTVSIPQAVGTVATKMLRSQFGDDIESFNTASGRHCCNYPIAYAMKTRTLPDVSIPQAVGTVATP